MFNSQSYLFGIHVLPSVVLSHFILGNTTLLKYFYLKHSFSIIRSMSLTHDIMFSFFNYISIVWGSIWTFFIGLLPRIGLGSHFWWLQKLKFLVSVECWIWSDFIEQSLWTLFFFSIYHLLGLLSWHFVLFKNKKTTVYIILCRTLRHTWIPIIPLNYLI